MSLKKAAQVTTEKVTQKVGEMVVEKGAEKIQQILRKRSSQDAKKKLQKILQNQVPKKNCIKVDTKSNFRKSNLISPSKKIIFTFIYRLFRSIATMFRSPQYLEKTEYIQINLDTPLTFPGNNQTQQKSGHKFTARDRDNFYDWYNAYFSINFMFEATANGARIGANTESAPVNGSFSLSKSMTVKSTGKSVYEANDIHKVIFIENLLDFSDDYSRSVAKNQFWYLDNDATTVTSDAATNLGMRQRALLSQEGITVETILPLTLSSKACPTGSYRQCNWSLKLCYKTTQK